MYCIFTVVYGIPCHTNDYDHTRSELVEEHIEIETDGFFSVYSGNGGQQPAAFGIIIGSFNEACHHVELSTIPTVSAGQIEEFNKLYNALDHEVQAELFRYGPPRVFFLAGSS